MGNMYFGPNHGQINIIQNVHRGCARPPRPNSHPILTAFVILFALGLLIKFWWVVLMVLAVWLGVKGLGGGSTGNDWSSRNAQGLLPARTRRTRPSWPVIRTESTATRRTGDLLRPASDHSRELLFLVRRGWAADHHTGRLQIRVAGLHGHDDARHEKPNVLLGPSGAMPAHTEGEQDA